MSLTLGIEVTRTWHRAAGPAMGSVAEILVDGDAAAVASGFARLRSIEAALSRFRPDSELNELLRAGGRWLDVGADLFAALTMSRRMSALTGGIFDPTIRAALERSGYSCTFADVRDNDDELVATLPPGIDTVELDERRRRVRIRPGTLMDLGGIGKGLAADTVAAELVRDGARAAFVSVGGDLHAAGEAPEGGWSVPLLHPLSDAVITNHLLHGGGMAMSTVAFRRWRRGRDIAHHLIDPRTGLPAVTDVIAVAVAAPSAARAEALAKSALVIGSTAGEGLLRRTGVAAWIVTATGTIAIATPEPACWP